MGTQHDDVKNVCHGCIGNQFLAKEVKVKGSLGLCSYCGHTRDAVVLDNFAERVHKTLAEHFYLTPNYPTEPHEYLQASEHNWERRGTPVESAIADMACIQEKLATDVTRLLSTKYGYWVVREEGREDPYGIEAMYQEKGPDSSFFQSAWKAFCDEITSSTGSLSSYAEATLDEIFGDLPTLRTSEDDPVIRKIDPEDEDTLLWRGRTALSDEELATFLKCPSRELGPPPPERTKAGRMNPEGIPVFYGSLDKTTCVSEVRAPVGSHVVIGKFQLLQPVALLDLDALAKVCIKGSYFDPNYSRQKSRAAFLTRLVTEVSRPILPHTEALEYLSTQVVAEYLATKLSPRLDGIIFRSSQTGGTGRNLVLFNHACLVQPYELPQGTEVEASIYSSDQYDEDDDEVIVFETVPSNQHGEEMAVGVRKETTSFCPYYPRGIYQGTQSLKFIPLCNSTLTA